MTWDGYLEGFHAGRPGITESVLRRARAGGTDPYAWLAEVVPPNGRVLDLGCGSAPLFRMLAGRTWIGLDTSAAELAAARSAGARPLLRARASAIPLRDGSVDVVACSMSLMVTTPLPQVIAEITRVLRPGGLLAATIPAAGPLPPPDRVAVAGLIAALGRAPAYPAGRGTPRIPDLLAGHGLQVTADSRRRFGYRLRGAADADRCVSQPTFRPSSELENQGADHDNRDARAHAGDDRPGPVHGPAAGRGGRAGRAAGRAGDDRDDDPGHGRRRDGLRHAAERGHGLAGLHHRPAGVDAGRSTGR